MKAGRKPIPHSKPSTRSGRALAFPLTLFFSFLFFIGSANGSTTYRDATFLIDQTVGHDLHKNRVSFSQGRAGDHPANPVPSPWEPDPTDQKDRSETNDNFDDEADKFFSRSSFNPAIDVIAAKRLLQQLSLSSKNREKVSLIILHHSWKIFLH